MLATRGTRVVAVTGAAICTAVAAAVSAATYAIRANGSPIVPDGKWQQVLTASIAVSFAAYVCSLLVLRRVAFDWRFALGIAGAIQTFPLLGPVLLSTDVEVYATYGEAARNGANPYIETTTNQVPSVYGPLFTLWSELIEVTAGSVSGSVIAHRAAAVAAILLCAWLASRLSENRSLAIVLVGWNPLVALHYGGGGHNDALMIALALLAVTASGNHRWLAAGGLWAASALVKLLTLSLIPIAALGLLRRYGSTALVRFAVGAGVAGVVIGVVASARYGTAWIDAAIKLSDVGGRTGSIGLSHWLDDAGLSETARDRVVTGLQAGTVLVLSVHAAVSGRARLGLAAALLACFQGWLNPWYALWGLALSAADDGERAGRIVSVVLSGYLLLDVTTW